MNYFGPDWVAPRYARSRPDVHTGILAHVRERLGGAARPRAALDVGCGTGLSTRPLGTFAATAVGVDPSRAMLREAHEGRGALYVAGRAEALPFRTGGFDLVTIGCAYHWCETKPFLTEAARVLRPGGRLLIYDSYPFVGSPPPSPVLDWLRSEHWARLPRTPRNPLPDVDTFSHPSFALDGSGSVEVRVPMSRRDLVTYLTTQSGAVATVESGGSTLAEMEGFLLSGLADLVPEEGDTFPFGGPFWILTRRG